MAQTPATPAPAPASPTVKPEEIFEARVYKTEEHGDLPYRLLRPLNVEPLKKYPLVLFLHGAGERGVDNVKQLIHGGQVMASQEFRTRYPAYIVVPQCPEEQKWVEVPWDALAHDMPREPSPALRLVFQMLDAVRHELPVDDKRIYGVGLSMGGYGVWDILQRRPQLLAAGVPVCGGGDPRFAARFKDTPVWAFQGGADPVVKPERSRAMVRAPTDAGGRPIYTEYEGVEHNSWTRTFENRLMWDWMFAQKKP